MTIPPNGWAKLPDGIRCRCINSWYDKDGSYWCCQAGAGTEAVGAKPVRREEAPAMKAKWKPISEYKPGPYRGYDELLLVGWTNRAHGGVLGCDVAWRDLQGGWHSRRDGEGYGMQPDLYALVITDIPNTMEGYISTLRANLSD